MPNRRHAGMQGSMIIPTPAEAAAGRARYYLNLLVESCRVGTPTKYWHEAALAEVEAYPTVKADLAKTFEEARTEAQRLWDEHPNHPSRRAA